MFRQIVVFVPLCYLVLIKERKGETKKIILLIVLLDDRPRGVLVDL